MTTGSQERVAAPPAGGRWWAPGAVVGGVAAVVGWATTQAWRAFEAAGCGSPGAKFECLGESLLGAAVAVVLGPVLLWLAYRAAGVRRPVLSVGVAVAVAAVLTAAPELVHQVRLLAGVDRPLDALLGVAVGAVLGLAAFGGGLALQGPRRARRALVAAGLLGALGASALLLAAPADRAEDRLELLEARVPLLLPGPGWEVGSAYVGEGGDSLSYRVVPVGFDGYGFEGVSVEVTRDLGTFGDSCSYRPCTDVGDVRLQLPEPGEEGPPTAWRVVDGHLVTVGRYGDGIELDPVDLLAGMAPASVEETLDRRFDDPG